MATIKGKWVFNANLTTPTFTDVLVNFISNENSYTAISYGYDGEYDRNVIKYNSTVVFYYDYYANDWNDDAYRTVDFGTTEQTVSDTFLSWLTANATPEAEPTPTDVVTIEYNGSVIASLKSGQSATLPCKDTLMHTDVVVTVPDGLGAGEVVEEWDGSYTISGGTISFTIDGVSYEAEDGMTWEQWVASDYNTGGYSIGYADGIYGFVVDDGDGVVVNEAMRTEAIINGKAYTTYAAGPA